MPPSEFEEISLNSAREYRMLSLETVENLDNNTFWDPNSMDTLIFNSYVGGACIFESNNDKIELLRINKKFALLFGNKDAVIESALKIKWVSCFCEAEMEKARDAVRRANETNDEITFETFSDNLSTCPHK